MQRKSLTKSVKLCLPRTMLKPQPEADQVRVPVVLVVLVVAARAATVVVRPPVRLRLAGLADVARPSRPVLVEQNEQVNLRNELSDN